MTTAPPTSPPASTSPAARTRVERRIIDPRTGEVIDAYPVSSAADVEQAVKDARSALPRWSRLTPSERSTRLRAFADRIDDTRAVHEAVIREARARGVSTHHAMAEVADAVETMHFYAAQCHRSGPVSATYAPRTRSRVSVRPLGVVGAILPWNYPTLMLAWRLGPILAAGNTVVVKPAAQTPFVAQAVADLASSVLGPGVVTVVAGCRTTGRHLVSRGGLDAVAFTGSRDAGAVVQAAAAPRPVVLELGGNCPAIFCDDAYPRAEHDLIEAALHNAGQSCAAPSRIVVLSDTGLERLSTAMSIARVTCPLIDRHAHERTSLRVEAAAASVYHQALGQPVPATGYWFQPRLLAVNAGSPMLLRAAETFAPVVTVERAVTLSHALALATDPACNNDLAASVWTADLAAAEDAAESLSRHVGEVWVNCHLVQAPGLPHGGSGGVDLSASAVEQYLRPTAVTVRHHRH